MRSLILGLVAALVATASLADGPVPDRRVAISRGVDFYGSDLKTIFDTTLDVCEAACLADSACHAFTYNTQSAACFPKSEVSDVTPYARAISARVYATESRVIAGATDRLADLSMVTERDITSARQLATDIGRLYSTDEVAPEQLLTTGRSVEAAGNRLVASQFVGAALAVTDAPDQWIELARLTRLATGNTTDVNEARRRSVPAAINGYLRAQDDATRTSALIELAQGLEVAERGRTMIAVLRLAQGIQPRRDTADLLEAAIAKYGFRVVDTAVEADTATPRVCAVFSEPLARAGVDYSTYVQLPDQRLAVVAADSRLCVEGVEHGSTTRIVLREGLPAASGESLSRAVELSLYVRDRTPAVRFLSSAYVLPRTGDIAIPVESVNLPEAEVTLRRMTDRNIIRARQDGLLGQPVYPWTADYLDDSVAEVIWTGTAALGQDLNRDVTTRVPLAEMLAGQPAGVYVATAQVPGADPYDSPPASQWFILTDLGLATYLGTDGLTVAVRGLTDAAARAGVAVALYSEGNALLGEATTDDQGVAHFEAGLTRGTGTARPALVVARQGEDLAYLSLADAAFDLSDRGVEGRESSGPIDVFLTPDRGAYRAGETIHLTALMRDATTRAVEGLPLTAILTRPDGVEYSRSTSVAAASGGHVFAIPVSSSAPRGPWRIAVYADPNAASLASTTVLVEDFLPERIDFDLDMAEVIGLTEAAPLTVSARYLFGAAAADLPVEGEVLLREASGLPGFEGYTFGRYDETFAAQIDYLDGTTTDAIGAATLTVALPDVTDITRPLEARVTVRISEGSGRPVERSTTATVRPDGPMIGIKPEFDEVVPESSRARFSLIALSPDLATEPMQVSWKVNRLRTRYQWYSLYGSWNWEPVTTRETVASGIVDLTDGPVSIEAAVDWGRYEVVAERVTGDYLASATDFYAGWYAPADTSTTPDVLEASLDATSYAIGDTATFRIVPRYAGTAVVTVLSDHLIHMETVEVNEGENLIPLTVTDEWGAGAYVSASVIRPMDVAAGHNPARALGLGYAAVAPGDKALSVTLDAPAEMEPRQPLAVRVAVGGVAEGDTAFVTLAAVDVGILNLTAFQSPDPSAYYFGQRKLGVELRDVYGRLIDGLNGALGSVRSGGDAMAAMTMQSPPPTEELVAYFEGPITVGPDGYAEAEFTLPSFNGTVRLMAVAWSDRAVGQASTDVLVRDPVVLTTSAPRFLAPGDQSRVLLEVVHADGPTGNVALSVRSKGLALASQMITSTFDLDEGQRLSFSLPFAAADVGDQTIDIDLTTPDGRVLSQQLVVPVRANDPEVSRQSRFTLAAGETFTFDAGAFAGLQAGTAQATLSIGALGRFNAPGLLTALDQYPYGCTEQLTSRALPLLYFSDLTTAMGLASRDQVDLRISQAITEVLSNQAANGSFGLWYPSSGDLWLDSYVTDFLSRARAKGHTVPDLAFRNAVENLRNRVNYYPDFDAGGQDLAYALMVLAREGTAAVGDLRYYADQKEAAFATPLAAAQLGAALAFYGDQTRADRMFRAANVLLDARAATEETAVWRSDYGTMRRDDAAVLTLAVEAGSQAVNRDAIISRIARTATNRMSTQEATWTLLAANAMLGGLDSADIVIDGAKATGPLVRVIDSQTAATPIMVANTGTEPTALTLTTFGVPTEPEPKGGNGYAIERAYFTMEGEPVAEGAIAVGTRMVAVLTVTPFGYQAGRLMVNDPLPAGFEIDNPNLLQSGEVRALDWLEPVQGESAQFRTDRFLAAVDWQSDRPFRLAYIVRAVSPGRYHHPAASVEDMYRPDYRARTAAGDIVVTE